MGDARRIHKYTLREYMALEQASDQRYEYRDGDIVCMTGGTLNHGRIASNIHFLIQGKLAGRNCDAFTGDLAIKSPASPYYCYPDLSVVCGEVATEKVLGIDTIVNPIVIIEVLSPTSQEYDRTDKRQIYQALPSLREYLLISQDSAHIVDYLKQGDLWQRSEAADLSASIELPSIEVVLSFADIYRNVKFD